MKKMKIEFFHDVICSFCFPMSHRMRQVQKEMPEVEIVHRSYLLLGEDVDTDTLYGSREAAKEEMAKHWAHANWNDDLHRFNIQGLMQSDMALPRSVKPLLACQAAHHLAGEAGYWDVFDGLQKALYMDVRDIEDIEVLRDVVQQAGLDVQAWEKRFNSPENRTALAEELKLVQGKGVDVVPYLIINGKYHMSGARRLPQILSAIRKVMEEEAGEEGQAKGLNSSLASK